jgi:hypothetical protein
MVLRTLLQARGNLDSSCLPSTLLSFDNDLPPVKGLERGRIQRKTGDRYLIAMVP